MFPTNKAKAPAAAGSAHERCPRLMRGAIVLRHVRIGRRNSGTGGEEVALRRSPGMAALALGDRHADVALAEDDGPPCDPPTSTFSPDLDRSIISL